MDLIQIAELLAKEGANRQQAEEMALNTVASVEIPLHTILATLSRQQLLKFLIKFETEFKKMSESQKCVFLTLITDVVTAAVKHNSFYDSFQGNSDLIINRLCLLLKAVYLMSPEELKQIAKYAERIPQYPSFTNALDKVNTCTSEKARKLESDTPCKLPERSVLKENKNRNNIKKVKTVITSENGENIGPKNSSDAHSNIHNNQLKKQMPDGANSNMPNNQYKKTMAGGANSSIQNNQYKKTIPDNAKSNIQNNQLKKPMPNGLLSDKNISQTPKNAFDVLMNSAARKKIKLH